MSQAVDERTDALVLDVSVVGAGQAFPSSCSKALLASAIRGGVVYDSLVLFSPRSYSALPGLVMPGDPDGDPNKDHVADYLERYAERFGLPMAFASCVSSAAAITSSGGRIDAVTLRAGQSLSRPVHSSVA